MPKTVCVLCIYLFCLCPIDDIVFCPLKLLKKCYHKLLNKVLTFFCLVKGLLHQNDFMVMVFGNYYLQKFTFCQSWVVSLLGK